MFRFASLLAFLTALSLQGETVSLPPRKGAVLILSGDGFSADYKLRLSGELTLTCLVEEAQTVEVSSLSISIEPVRKDWEVLGHSTKGPLLKDEHGERWEQSITLAPTQPGSLTLPVVLLRYRDGTMVRWDNQTIQVIGPPPAQAGSIRGETAPESLPELPPAAAFPLLWLILGGAGAGVLATGVVFLMRRPRVEITLPPRERALRDLERLRGEQHPHERLSLILRTLAEGCLGFPATRQTTEEVLDAARKLDGIGEEVWCELEPLLGECDRVKFAGTSETRNDVDRLLSRARDWVEKISPVAVAGSGN